MTETQILSMTIAIVFPAVAMAGSIAALMYANKRLDDFKTSLDKRFDDMKGELIRHMDTGFEHMELLLKLHEAEHHKH